MEELLKDKVVVVTGGVGLLGREFIKGIMKCGGIGIIADINEEKGREIEKELLCRNFSGKCEFVNMDITDKNSISKAIDYLHKKYGKVDALVNSAYPRNENYGRDFLEVEFGDFCENIKLHLGGYFLASQQFIKYFLRQGYGNIIILSSIYGVIPPRFEIYRGTKMTMPVEYAAIKSALIHLTKYMAKYLKGKNIRVNCISPGGILDNQPSLFVNNYKKFCLNKGMLDKSDIVGTILFLLSDLSTYVNGQNIIVDDGFCL